MRLRSIPFITLLVCLDPSVFAQELTDFEPVEASVADVSVLSTSLRVEERGLDPGTGFTQVYQVPGVPGAHFRANGGLFAVFDQSVYLSWNGMNFPEVPPSTTFYIGAPEFLRVQKSTGSSEDSSPSRQRITEPGARGSQPGYGFVPPASAMAQRPDALPAEALSAAQSEELLPRFHTDPGYRSRRLTEIRLLHRTSGLQSSPD
ncbi:MAG: hypothetical protein CBC35_12045 [Planctomycetes bacterium TMED75]|nr:hypothetical protein [Planctomycetaceae bacterium]OUU90459.1 MAG: hypothetical protein CBC35_12045 [Planctomycetes bacterium TMED75]